MRWSTNGLFAGLPGAPTADWEIPACGPLLAFDSAIFSEAIAVVLRSSASPDAWQAPMVRWEKYSRLEFPPAHLHLLAQLLHQWLVSRAPGEVYVFSRVGVMIVQLVTAEIGARHAPFGVAIAGGTH